MAGTWADHGPRWQRDERAGRRRRRASMTAGMSRAPARSRSAIAAARSWAASRPASSAARRVRHSHRAWWPGSLAVAGRQAGQEQVVVALLAGGGGLGGPDGVQDRQVVGVGQGAVPGLGGGGELAVSFQDGGQHGERLAGRGGWGGRGGGAGSFGLDLVVAVQFGGRAGAGGGVGALGGHGEHVGDVDAGAAGQGDVGVRAVLGAGDHGQAGVSRCGPARRGR